MKQFAALIAALDQTTSTTKKKEALMRYFREAPEADRIWTIALFTHRRPRRSVNTTLLRAWAGELAGIPLWMVEECWHIAGDMSECLAALLPPGDGQCTLSLAECMDEIGSWKSLEPETVREAVVNIWMGMSRHERFVFNKLITGGFRVGVSQQLLVQSLAKLLELEDAVVALRLSGNWRPQTTSWRELLLDERRDDARLYPFYLAYPLEQDLAQLGQPEDWYAEWKWDGIRGQLVSRGGQVHLWSRGEELISAQFPELTQHEALAGLNAVVDGEILAWSEDKPMPFQVLQSRLGRKQVSASTMKKAPVVMLAYDLLEWEGEDIRHKPHHERRALLEDLLRSADLPMLKLSPLVSFESWQELKTLHTQSREQMAEGFMLKQRNATYQTGRRKGSWWKWKTDPYTVDAVMIYAQRGHGRRAGLYTDFTFAVYDAQRNLVPFTKAYSGLSDDEFSAINRWIKDHTIERFGPVCSVEAQLVFEIAFEGIGESKRHKSGVAVRFPRMVRWRRDKTVQEINTLDDLRKMIGAS
ncbi:MAG: ATP-dependent DNA ligase [Bacteroidetes bacterium]|nr:ATP-dependent DNA ligase [Bacteroidota bacterium]